jgi:hypothetical protein
MPDCAVVTLNTFKISGTISVSTKLHLVLTLEQDLVLNPFDHKILKKYAANNFNENSSFAALCSQCIFQGGRLQDFPGTFEFWTFIFVHFRGAMPFLFTCFIRVIE